MVCLLSNAKISSFLIIKKMPLFLYEKFNNFILLTKYLSLSSIYFLLDNILSSCMVMLQCATPRGHVVTFHFLSFGVNEEKSTLY